jgi:hypothetical protein
MAEVESMAVPPPVGMGMDREEETEPPAQRTSPAETAFLASSGLQYSSRQLRVRVRIGLD